MHQLILDAEIAAEACMLNGRDEAISILLERADREGWRLWLYTGQLTEILHRLCDSLSNRSSSITTDSASLEAEARGLLKRFVSRHHWLSALSEDAEGLDELDSILLFSHPSIFVPIKDIIILSSYLFYYIFQLYY